MTCCGGPNPFAGKSGEALETGKTGFEGDAFNRTSKCVAVAQGALSSAPVGGAIANFLPASIDRPRCAAASQCCSLAHARDWGVVRSGRDLGVS